MASTKSLGKFVEGAEDLERSFTNLPFVLQTEALRPGLREGAKVTRAALMREAPRGKLGGKKKERLAKGWKVRAIKRSRVRIGARVITSVKYAAAVILGRKTKKGNKIPGNRFDRAAMEISKPQAFQAMIGTVRKKLPEVIRKAKAKGRPTEVIPS